MKNRIFYLPVLLVLGLFAAGLLLGCKNPVNNVEETEYTVTFMPNGADGGTVPAPITRTVGSEITIPGNTGALTLANHYFDGWNTQANGSGTAFPADKRHTLTGNLTLHAQWRQGTPQQYTVTFMANGATGGTVPEAITGAHGSIITIPGNTGALTLANHYFDGWNTQANGGGTAFAANAQHTLTGNLTLHAQWAQGQQPVGYTITFMPNGATGGAVPEPITGAPGSTVTIPVNVGALSRDDHQWGGWNTQPDGSGDIIRHGHAFPHTLTGNLTLYARWWPWPENAGGTFNLTFLPNGADSGNVPVAINSLDGTIITIPGNTGALLRTGHRFEGWNTAADGSGTAFPVGAAHRVFANLTLHAHWVPGEEVMFTVTYDANGAEGSGPPPQTVPRGTNKSVIGPVGLTKEGHGFTSWNTAANGSGTAFRFGDRITVNEDITLYAQWGAMVTITFDANGGTGPVPSGPEWTAAVGSIRIVPSNGLNNDIIVRSGYSFDRWNTASDGTGKDYRFLTHITFTTDLTLYAKWVRNAEWEMVSSGWLHSLGIRNDGSLWAWGGANNGALGIGIISGGRTTPTRVGTDNDWVYVSAGVNHSLGIRADGSLWAWGSNLQGRTGLGTSTGNQVTPVRVGTDTNWEVVSAGATHSLGIRKDGSLWAWGFNESGRTGLGIGTNTLTLEPALVCDDHEWKSVSASMWNSFAVREDGTLWAWGDNFIGVTGIDNTTDEFLVPAQVGIASNWASVSAGRMHTLATRADGTLWAWGSNQNGMTGLGVSGFTHTFTPTRVGNDYNWASASAGDNFSLGRRTDGTVWSWGLNAHARTGRGTTTGNQTTPAQIGNDTNWRFISAGTAHGLAIRDDGSLWAWGDNESGNTGQNTTFGSTHNPMKVISANP